MWKFTARVSQGSDYTQTLFNDLNRAISWLGDCSNAIGTVYRNSTNRALYQIEHGEVNFDRRMRKEKD